MTFVPNQKFFDLMEGCKEFHIIEAYSKLGVVTGQLFERGHAAVAIHPEPAPSDFCYYPVFRYDPTSYSYPKGCAVLIGNPVVGVSSRIVDRAIECAASIVLYVGHPSNREIDLRGYHKKFRLWEKNVGRLHENLYWMEINAS